MLCPFDGALVASLDEALERPAFFSNELQHVVRTTLRLRDYADFGALNAVHGRRLQARMLSAVPPAASHCGTRGQPAEREHRTDARTRVTSAPIIHIM